LNFFRNVSILNEHVTEDSVPAMAPASPHAVIRALGNPVRWAILRELARGEALLMSELARR
jgi:hypothetical protein